MTVHIDGVTMVSDGELDAMRRWTEAAKLAFQAGSWDSALENLRRLDAFIVAIKTGSDRPKLQFDYGRALIRDIKRP